MTKFLGKVLDQISKHEYQGRHEICENARKIVNWEKDKANQQESKVDMHPCSNNSLKQFLTRVYTFNFRMYIILFYL